MSAAQPPRSATPTNATPPLAPNGAGEARKEDPTATRLRRAWRSLASSLVVAARAAEKTAKAQAAAEQRQEQQQGGAAPAHPAQVDRKAVDDALITTLRARAELRRVASLVEAKLRGNAKETEALELCLRSQPCVGRKRNRVEEVSGKDTGLRD